LHNPGCGIILGHEWDGVSNPQALGYLARMAKGDLALIYHAGKAKSIVGFAEIARGPYPNPAAEDPKLVVVDVRPKRMAPEPLPLTKIKADKRFANFPLVRQPRLSVMPVPPELWHAIVRMAGL
jgi:predicted RNA-binding protein with PUA-like domain